AADQQEQVVDDDGDGEDVDGVAPGEDLEEARQAQATASRASRASQTSRSWTVSPTSCTRSRAAPFRAPQAAVARLPPNRSPGVGSRRPRRTALARKLLRLAPRRRGRPSAA